MFTVWTNAFDHYVTVVHLETWRQHRLRHLQMVEAVGSLAYLTIEVGVLVIVMLLTVTVAEFIFSAVAAAIDGVYQMVFTEQGEGTEDVRLVDSGNATFQLCQRLRQHGTGQCSHHYDTVGSGLNAMLFEQAYT